MSNETTTVEVDDGKSVNLGTKQTTVHKSGEEGVFVINTLSGRILTPVDELPEWADGLVMALPAERVQWYKSRLGEQYPGEFALPELCAYEDLSWECIADSEGSLGAYTREADTEFRLDALAELMGGLSRVDNLDEDITYGKGNVLAEVEIGVQTGRGEEEIIAFNTAQQSKFDDIKKTGT